MASQEEAMPLFQSKEELVLFDSVANPGLDWVAEEPRGIASRYVDSLVGAFQAVEDRGPSSSRNWVVIYPSEIESICSRFSGDRFSIYEYVFKEIGF